MTVLTSDQITSGFTIAPLAPSSSGGPAGAGLGGRIDTDWRRTNHANASKTKAERRAAIRAAAAKVEAGATKAERLAAQQSGGRVEIRQVGSEKERASTRGSVARAAASLADVPLDTDFSGEDFRTVREMLRQLYPGAKLSEMLQEAARLEQMLMSDPVAAYEALLAAYSRAKPAPQYYKDPITAKGLRGSLARARIDQEDMEDLRDWIAKYGKRIPQILAELMLTDTRLRANTNYEAARLAARFGAPATAAEIPAYEQKMAAKQHQQALYDRRMELVGIAIQGGLIPGDEASLNEIAEVFKNPKFQHNLRDELDSLRRAGAIIRHPDHVWLTTRKGAAKASGKRDRGQLSISGAPGNGQDGAYADPQRGQRSARAAVREAQSPGSSRRSTYRGEAGSGSIKDSIARVRAAM